MTESEFDKLMMLFTEKQIKLLEKLLSNSIDSLSDLLLTELKNPDATGQRLKEVYEIYDEMDAVFVAYITPTLRNAFKLTITNVYELLNESAGSVSLDAKAITTLIKDAIHDFTSATENGRRVAAFYFKISKQELITESQLSQAVAQSLLDKGYGYDAKIAVRELLKSKESIVYDKNSLMKRITKDTKELSKIKANLRDDYMQKVYDKAYAEKKYLQIINKNGDIMNFQTDTYAALVSRSRIGDSQVQGAIEAGNSLGTVMFKVTSHNTQTAICKPHESKVYTSSKEVASLNVWQYLNDKNRPIYHPNCQHRLVPMPYTDSNLIKLAKRKGVSDSELTRVFGSAA